MGKPGRFEQRVRPGRFAQRSRSAAAFLAAAVAALSLAWAEPPRSAPDPKNPPSPKVSEESWSLFQRVFSLILRDYVDPKTPSAVVAGALQGAALAAGPESAYIPPEQVAPYRSLEKPGASLPLYLTKGDDFARVLAVYPGQGKGIEPGDFLKSVGGASTYDQTYPQCLLSLRGKAGEKVECVFIRHDAFEPYILHLPYVEAPRADWVARPKGGILVLAALSPGFPEDVAAAVRQGKGPVLVDLRSCAEGDFRAALNTAGFLLGKQEGPPSKGQKGSVRHPLQGVGLLAGKKVRVLVGPGTARGGEVLAAALEKSGALLVGEPTFGWAPFTEEFPLENGGLLRIHTGFFVNAKGEPLRERGLEPGVKLEAKEGEGVDSLYDRALIALPSAGGAVSEAGAPPRSGT